MLQKTHIFVADVTFNRFNMKKFLLLAFILVSSTLSAEVGDSVITHTIDELTVTSFYRSATTAGSTLDSKDIQSSNYGQEPSWLMSRMPSIFSFSDNGTEFGYGYFRIRGLDQTRVNATLDGMPWNEAEDFGIYFANCPDILADASSISVDRGTGTYNPGSSSYGGSINIESVNLLKDTVSYVHFGGGSFGTYKSSVNVNTGIVGNFAFHVRATQQQTDGYRHHSGNNSKSLGIKVGRFFNDRHSIDLLSITGYHRNGQGFIGSTVEELETDRRDNGCSKDEDDNFFQTVNKLQYKGWLSDKVMFTSSVYWQMLKGEYRFDLDNYLLKICGDDSANTGILYNYGLVHHLYGGNAVGRYYFDGGNITVGVNAFKFEREHYLDDRNVGKARNVGVDEYYDNRGHKFDLEGFLSVKKEFGKLSASANAQYRHVNFWYSDLMNPSVVFDEGTKWNFLNMGANLEYIVSRNSELYLKYARAYREPTRTDMFGGTEWYCDSVGITTTEAEVSNDFELGINVSSKRLKMNINLFAMLFENERALTGEIGENGLPKHEKADNSHRIGAELYLDYEPVRGLHVINNSSMSDNKVKTLTFGRKNHTMSPGFTFLQAIEYRGAKYTVGAEYKYRGKFYIDAENKFTVPASRQLNVYASYKLGQYVFSGHVNNLTNRDNLQTGIITDTNKARFMADAPTNFMISAKYLF